MRKIDLFYHSDKSELLVKIVMYDAEDRALMNTDKDYNYRNKTSIRLEAGEHIIGIRGRVHNKFNASFDNLQFILYKPEGAFASTIRD